MAEMIDKHNCPNCGAPLKVSQGEIIVVCSYCDSTVSLKAGKKYYIGHSIIPAKFDKARARSAVLSWMKGGFYKPDDLQRRGKVTELTCTYLPFFVFDVRVVTSFKGYLTRTGNSEKREDTLEKEYPWKVLARRGSKFPSSEFKIPLAGKVPFSISDMMEGARFLNAEMDEKEAQDLARSEIGSHQRHLLENLVDEVMKESTEIEFRSTELVHAPVWVVRYEYKGKDFVLHMDACTGEVFKAQVPAQDTSIGGMFGSLKRSLFGD